MTSDDTAAAEPGEGRTPALDRTAFDCPRCGAYAKQTWKWLGRTQVAGIFQDTPGGDGYWKSALCAHCEDFSVWRDDRMIFPSSGLAPVPHTSMPPEAKALYEEAREIVGISRRAGAALARAALERLLRTLDPDAGKVNLATRIERIIPTVPEPLGQMLTIIRVAGNSAVHPDDEPDDVLVLVLDPREAEVVELMFEAINELVDEKIAKPAKVASLYDRVPESIREMVEKKTKKAD